MIAIKAENAIPRPAPENKKYVYVRLSLDESQWKKECGGWDCSNIGMRIETLDVFVNGVKQHEENYELDRITNVIRWRTPKRPNSILAIFGTTDSLSSGELTQNLKRNSKKFKVLSYALGALLTTLFAPTAVNVLTDAIINPAPRPAPLEVTPGKPAPEPRPPVVMPDPPTNGADVPLDKNTAIRLIENYAAAKSDIFGPPYQEELLIQFTHSDGPLYKDAIRNLRQLKKDQKHYKYERFEIKSSESFFNEKTSPKLVLVVDENSALIHRDGLRDRGLSNPVSNKRIQYEFRKEGEIWKIYDGKEI